MAKIVIDGIEFLLYEEGRGSPYEVVERGEPVYWSRDLGFLGGMGAYYERRPDDYYVSRNIDATSFPYLRLGPGFAASIAMANLDGTIPCYFFKEKSDVDWTFILNGSRIFKIQHSNNTLETDLQLSVSSVAGRPALFEGSWYIPQGASVNARKLTTVANDGAGADTYTDLGAGERALHYASFDDRGTAKIAKAFDTNKIATSSDGVTFLPAAGFEVGDSSLPIVDLLVYGNELVVIKPDNDYRFDAEGNAVGLVPFGARHKSLSSTLGARSLQYGEYTYWVHFGLWRIVGNAAVPIGPEADPRWSAQTLDGFSPLSLTAKNQWLCADAWGKNFYAVNKDDLFHGEIQADGRIVWHGSLVSGSAFTSIGIVDDGGGLPILWSAIGGTLRRINLASDGSVRAPSVSVTYPRGRDATTHQWIGPIVEGRGGERANKPWQWRKMGVNIEQHAGATVPVQLAAFLGIADTSTNVGAVITSNGVTEVSFPENTLANFIQPTIKILTTGFSPTATDIKIRRIWVESYPWAVYRARIDLRRGFDGRDIRELLDRLRVKQGGPAITVDVTGLQGYEGSYSGFLRFVSDQIVIAKETGGGTGYVADVFIERYRYLTSEDLI